MEPPRLNLYCLPQTFDETVGAVFPYLRTMLDHTPATAGVPFPLWKDEAAELNVTLLEVSHFRRSAVPVFTFAVRGRAAGAGRVPVRLRRVLPARQPASGGGRAARQPALPPPRPADRRGDELDRGGADGRPHGHPSGLREAGGLPRRVGPLQTRVVHYSGYGDLQGGDGPAAFQRRVNDGLHLHPSEGPVAQWEFTAAVAGVPARTAGSPGRSPSAPAGKAKRWWCSPGSR